MPTLTQKEAEEWIRKAQRKAEQLAVKVSIFVVDDSGLPVAFSRMDGAGILTPDVAKAKAYTAVAFKRHTKDVAKEKKDDILSATSLMAIADGRLTILGGGVVVIREGVVIGGIGVSGATSDEDHECGLEVIP